MGRYSYGGRGRRTKEEGEGIIQSSPWNISLELTRSDLRFCNITQRNSEFDLEETLMNNFTDGRVDLTSLYNYISKDNFVK